MDKQAEAIADIERIAKRSFELHMQTLAEPITWQLAGVSMQENYRFVVRRLLHEDLIKVGRRPSEPEGPIAGQITIDDETAT